MDRYAIILGVVWVIAFAGKGAAFQLPTDQPDGPALDPTAARNSFEVSNGLKLDLLLAEPEIRQPLSTSFDHRCRLWVVQYLQYPEPAGIKMVSRDNFWRIVYDRLPGPPGMDVPGADRVSVFEPQPDGSFRFIKDFVSDLNIATAVTPTTQGVWILTPPHLVFYPDRNEDLVPDGDPEIHLEGFGLEDTHSVVNSLCMGPDGWLYAAQGSTVSGAVKSYQSKSDPIKSMGQLIWRYHPKRRVYEIFAEGGGNSFGVAMDDSGRLFSGHNGGDTRGFHYVQGGYFRKGFSKHGDLSNPFSFGHLLPMRHPPIQRFTHTMLACDSTSLQLRYGGSMLAVDPLHGTLIDSHLFPTESTFWTEDREVVMRSSDKWFRPVAISDGPDGAAYICDWYDSQVAHIYAHVGKLDRDHGRVYRLTDPNSQSDAWLPDMARATDLASAQWLVARLSHPLRWQRWKAIELLSEHPCRNQVYDSVVALLEKPSERSLEALWTLYRCGWLHDAPDSVAKYTYPISQLFSHTMPHVRLWAIRLACDEGALSARALADFVRSIETERHPEVVLQMAASIRRLNSEQAFQLGSQLLVKHSLSKDPRFNDMAWWMIDKHTDSHAAIRTEMLENVSVWKSELFCEFMISRLIQKWSTQKQPEHWALVDWTMMRVAAMPPSSYRDMAVKSCVAGFEAAFQGRPLSGTPNKIIESLSALGQPSLALKLRQGNQTAVADLESLIASFGDKNQVNVNRDTLVQAISILGEVPQPAAQELLEHLVTRTNLEQTLRRTAIRSLASYRHSKAPNTLLLRWSDEPKDIQAEIAILVSSRLDWSRLLLEQIDSGAIHRSEVPLECIRTLRLHEDELLRSSLDRFFPESAGMDLSRSQQLADQFITRIETLSGDPYSGKKLYATLCLRCHRLYGTGESLGPDLTGYQRDNLRALLLNIVAPSLEVREGYQGFQVQTEDEQMISGLLESQTDDQLVIRGLDGVLHSLSRREIANIKPQSTSIMPQGILDPLSDQALADLVSYLRTSQPLGD